MANSFARRDPANGTSTLTIVLGNPNAGVETLSALFTDTLPTAPGVIQVARDAKYRSRPVRVLSRPPQDSGTITYANGATIPVGVHHQCDVTGATAGVHTNNIPAAALQTDFGNNQQPANATLTVSTLGYITGRVFQGQQRRSQRRFRFRHGYVAGRYQHRTAYRRDMCRTLLVQSGLVNPTTTDVLGNYAFTALPAGMYSVCEPVQPLGTTRWQNNGGWHHRRQRQHRNRRNRRQSDHDQQPDHRIVLNSGGGGEISGSTGNNFAEIVPSSIAGTVFLDQNNDGTQQGADTGISGVTINLTGYSYGPNGVDNGGAGDDVAVSLTTTTDASGNYSFANLQPGKYTVIEPTQPPATSNGITTAGTVGNGGTAGGVTAPTVTPSRIGTIVLPPNTATFSNNFAEINNGRRISGTVFLDYNNNGLIDGSDHGISGQPVNLIGTDINTNPVSATTTTAADGTYTFTGLPEGTYTVDEPGQPAGTTNGITTAGSTGGTATNPTANSSRIAAINLTGVNTVSASNNFGEQVSAPDLALAKTHSPVQFSAGNANFYTLAVSNVGNLPTSGTVTVVDTLPAGMSLQTGSGSGWSCTGTTTVTCTSNAVIAAGTSATPITLRVNLVTGLSGQLLTNNAVVSGGSEPPGFDGNNHASDIVSVADAASISGTVWTDLNHDRVLNPGEPLMPGWTVELLLNGALINTTITNAGGAYSFTGLAPNSGYQVRFRNPATGQIFGNAVPNEAGTPATSGVTNAANPGGAVTTDGTLKSLTLVGGQALIHQSLPLDPTGVVYDAVTRLPVSGAVVTITGPPLFNATTQTVGGSATSATGADGIYQFVLLPGAPNGTYTLSVTSYPAGYLPAVSSLIAPCPGTVVVGAAPAPALIQDSITPPASGEAATCPGIVPGGAANSTQYFFSFNLTIGVSADVVNNHIPLDPILGGAIVMTKTTPLLNVSRGDLVPYTITATNTLSAVLSNINIDDQIPPGFRYRTGTSSQTSSTSLVGIHAEPQVSGRNLLWPNQTFAAGEKKTWKMMLVVGAGVSEGEYTNQVWALNSLVNSRVSNVASATVRVVPDPNFDCSDIIGKVFDDKNANGYQDQGEPGIPNVRIATPRGLLVTTDADGRFHVTCADVPNEDHGSNFVMKLDERTLPSGYRVTTENPRDVRLTRGKMVKLNFGATVHRVVRLEMNGAAFVADGVELQAAWTRQLETVPAQLKGRPGVLRIAYELRKDSPDLARKRVDAVAAKVKELWQKSNDNTEGKRNPLVIETELEGAQ